jgi:hypothetical protein
MTIVVTFLGNHSSSSFCFPLFHASGHEIFHVSDFSFHLFLGRPSPLIQRGSVSVTNSTILLSSISRVVLTRDQQFKRNGGRTVWNWYSRTERTEGNRNNVAISYLIRQSESSVLKNFISIVCNLLLLSSFSGQVSHPCRHTGRTMVL